MENYKLRKETNVLHVRQDQTSEAIASSWQGTAFCHFQVNNLIKFRH